MHTDEYREHLRGQDVPETEIEQKLQAVRAFEDGLKKLGTDAASAGKAEIDRYAAQMILDGSNTLENFNTLEAYALWRGLIPLYISLVEVTDCHNGIEVLKETIGKRHGAEVRDRIFRKPPPPLGADEAKRLAYTQAITARMAELLTPGERRAAWFQVQHGIAREDWDGFDAAEKKRYADVESLDSYLKLKHEGRLAAVRRMHDEKKLWFTMEITDEVLTFVTEQHHMQLGEHNGRRGVVVTKVPYQPAKMLHAEDDRTKRYHACHCPLIREAILRDEPVSPDVCYCSLGHASHFLAGIGLDGLEGEVLESAAQGDARCKFIFYLPEPAEKD